MTDLRTHWMRTVHEALCGLSAKRLMLGERIIGGECATADVTCHGCRAVPQPALPLPWLDDLARRLTGMAEHFARQAKHGGRAWESNALSETTCRDGVEAVTALRAILAALDAERDAADARGYARAMGEVVERCDASVADNAKGRRWDPYTMGLCDEMDRIVEWARERATAAERD